MISVKELIQRNSDEVDPDSNPVIELTLEGILPFSRMDLDLDHIRGLLDRAWNPLLKSRVRNRTTPAEFEVDVDVGTSRSDLERSILRELVGRDQRYRLSAEAWAGIALEVKRLSLEGAASETVIDLLQ